MNQITFCFLFTKLCWVKFWAFEILCMKCSLQARVAQVLINFGFDDKATFTDHNINLFFEKFQNRGASIFWKIRSLNLARFLAVFEIKPISKERSNYKFGKIIWYFSRKLSWNLNLTRYFCCFWKVRNQKKRAKFKFGKIISSKRSFLQELCSCLKQKKSGM